MSKIYKKIIIFFFIFSLNDVNAHVEHYANLNLLEFDLYRKKIKLYCSIIGLDNSFLHISSTCADA